MINTILSLSIYEFHTLSLFFHLVTYLLKQPHHLSSTFLQQILY